MSAVAEFEQARLHLGAIAEALDGWARFVRGPARALADYAPEDCTCPGCQWHDPGERRAVLRIALYALPTSAARELRALIEPLDRLYLSRTIPEPSTAWIRDLLTINPPRTRPNHAANPPFTVEFDLMYVGWLVVTVSQGRAKTRMYASDLTLALDDLLAGLISLTQGGQQASVSWNGEPTEYRWLLTANDTHAHIHLLILEDHGDQVASWYGHLQFTADMPLRTLVRTITVAARALLTRLGEDGYTCKWQSGPFPTSHLQTLEQWLGKELSGRDGSLSLRSFRSSSS
jgi:hypothetical protein